ncbi:MAG: hypothetical protein CME05_02210 [Gemmatimonadaceae bacterium]|nr:hypothetical protein [Gemmatimonadaceae bacterium]
MSTTCTVVGRYGARKNFVLFRIEQSRFARVYPRLFPAGQILQVVTGTGPSCAASKQGDSFSPLNELVLEGQWVKTQVGGVEALRIISNDDVVHDSCVCRIGLNDSLRQDLEISSLLWASHGRSQIGRDGVLLGFCEDLCLNRSRTGSYLNQQDCQQPYVDDPSPWVSPR